MDGHPMAIEVDLKVFPWQKNRWKLEGCEKRRQIENQWKENHRIFKGMQSAGDSNQSAGDSNQSAGDSNQSQSN